MPWSWAPTFGFPVHSENPNLYHRNGLLPVPVNFMRNFPINQNSNNAQPPHHYNGPYSSPRLVPQYDNCNHQNYNGNLPQYNGSFRSRRFNYDNERGTYVRSTSRWDFPPAYKHNRRHVSRQNPSVGHECANARLQSYSCDPSPRHQSSENLPSSRNVIMKKLPFSDVISSILQVDVINSGPSTSHYNFILRANERDFLLSNKNDFPYKVKLRFCKLDDSSEQEDYYPTLLQVAVNNKLCLLPGINSIPRGPPGPLNITFMCNLRGLNDVTVRNSDSHGKETLRMFVYLVKELTSQDLIERLKAKNPTKPKDTASQIKEKLQEDQTGNEIASTTFPCSLLCPLSKTRMKLPCRATSCSHFQCFDAVTYLQLNELKPKWSCPICSGPADYEHLQIDGYFKTVLEQNVSSDKILLLADGSWKPLQSDKKRRWQPTVELSMHNCTVSTPNGTVFLDSDSDCQDVSEKDERLGYSDGCQEVIEQGENQGFDCQEVSEEDETVSFECHEGNENNKTWEFDCHQIISEDETQDFDCQEVIEQEKTQEYSMNANAAKDVSSSVVTITLSDDDSCISNSQTSNCIAGFCSTPKTSVRRRSSHFQGSPVVFIDTTHTFHSSASLTPHEYSAGSSNNSKCKNRKRKKSSKKTNGTNRSISNFGNNSGISIKTSASCTSDVPHQRSSGRTVSSLRSTMRLRSADKPRSKKKKSRRGRSKK